MKNINMNMTKEYKSNQVVILLAIDKGAITKKVKTAAAVEYANNILPLCLKNNFINCY
jgi:hypothetical protein